MSIKENQDLLFRHVIFSPTKETVDMIGLLAVLELRKDETIDHSFMRCFRREADNIIRFALEGPEDQKTWIDIPHTIRLKRQKQDMKADRENDTNRYRAALDLDNWRDLVRFSPHMHTMTRGFLMNAAEFQERTGWIYKVIRPVTSVKHLVQYLLSHAPAIEGFDNVTYNGMISHKRFAHMGTWRVKEPVRCPECLAAGVHPDQAIMLLGIMPHDSPPTWTYPGSDVQLKSRWKRGATLAWWTCEHVTDKSLYTVRKVPVFRILQPGEKIDRQWIPKWRHTVTAAEWAVMVRDGVAPGVWC